MIDVVLKMTLSGAHFAQEMYDKIKELHEEQNKLDMVVLPGLARSGTSITYRCLDLTPGFKPKHELKLLGSKTQTEHATWRVVNYTVGKYFGAEALMPGSVWDKSFGDVLIGEREDKEITEDIRTEMDHMVGIFVWQDIKLLKEPMCVYTIPAWIDNYECFKNAKYIWNRRDIRQSAKSMVRLKVPDRMERHTFEIGPTGYRNVLTVKGAEKIYEVHEKILEDAMKKVNHIEVWHHDLINKPKETFARMSEFIGREIDTSPFNMGEVWTKK